MKTHYEVLGISPSATYNEIKTAYYKLTLKYHPDKNKGESAKEIFQEISNAYDVLSKYETRKNYDRSMSIKNESFNLKQNVKSSTNIKASYVTRPVSNKIFDFDEWVKNHYHHGFAKEKAKKQWQDLLEQHVYNLPEIIFLCALTFIITTVYGGYLYYGLAVQRKRKN
ncbi:DnaJ like protein subfamily B member 14 [Habropoda laboriosa]|uniref:DnaJ like protein subfamily B member 14 n=2 Tax=Habropoda laboriosa TaxID=597456 RepID=A0A0L7R4Q0_9HYME|nr:DnaJ like protein subfamily B member 14 [Habropoda laboriosa]